VLLRLNSQRVFPQRRLLFHQRHVQLVTRRHTQRAHQPYHLHRSLPTYRLSNRLLCPLCSRCHDPQVCRARSQRAYRRESRLHIRLHSLSLSRAASRRHCHYPSPPSFLHGAQLTNLQQPGPHSLPRNFLHSIVLTQARKVSSILK